MRLLPLLLLAAGPGLLLGCHEATTTTEAIPPAAPAKPAPAGPQCYAYLSARDTVRLTLATLQPTVTGSLTYQYFEKDRNRGTLSGAMHGDTLLADYTFQSEGSTSVRQVAFLRRGQSWVEGYGEEVTQGSKSVFKQPAQLKFSSDMPLSPTACRL